LIFAGSFIIGRFVWLPIDCLAAGLTTYSDVGGIAMCYKVRYESWWFNLVKLPFKVGELLKNPLTSITTIATLAATLGGLFKLGNK
jgi:hypothetical protein